MAIAVILYRYIIARPSYSRTVWQCVRSLTLTRHRFQRKRRVCEHCDSSQELKRIYPTVVGALVTVHTPLLHTVCRLYLYWLRTVRTYECPGHPYVQATFQTSTALLHPTGTGRRGRANLSYMRTARYQLPLPDGGSGGKL